MPDIFASVTYALHCSHSTLQESHGTLHNLHRREHNVTQTGNLVLSSTVLSSRQAQSKSTVPCTLWYCFIKSFRQKTPKIQRQNQQIQEYHTHTVTLSRLSNCTIICYQQAVLVMLTSYGELIVGQAKYKSDKLDKYVLGNFAAHIVGKYDDKVFEDREVSFLMREGNDFLSLNATLCQAVHLRHDLQTSFWIHCNSCLVALVERSLSHLLAMDHIISNFAEGWRFLVIWNSVSPIKHLIHLKELLMDQIHSPKLLCIKKYLKGVLL